MLDDTTRAIAAVIADGVIDNLTMTALRKTVQPTLTKRAVGQVRDPDGTIRDLTNKDAFDPISNDQEYDAELRQELSDELNECPSCGYQWSDAEKAAKAEEYREKASATTDPVLAKGYLALAAGLTKRR